MGGDCARTRARCVRRRHIFVDWIRALLASSSESKTHYRSKRRRSLEAKVPGFWFSPSPLVVYMSLQSAARAGQASQEPRWVGRGFESAARTGLVVVVRAPLD